MKKKKKFSFIHKINLKKEYQTSFNYLKDSKKFIYLSTSIFLLFTLIGFFVPVPKEIYNQIVEFIKEITLKTKDMSSIELISFIISNNLKSTFLSIFLGVILGIFPFIALISNGYILGFVALLSVEQTGVLSLLSLIPHGIFEFPAIFISTSLGLRLGLNFLFKNHKTNLKQELQNCFKVFLLIVFPLLILAGIIEGLLINLL